MPVEHYENFPVASLLLPARLRPAVEAIYAFARSADDLADEGEASDPERLASLNAYDAALETMAHADASIPPLFHALSRVVADYRLPLAPFHDLLSAFKQDVVTKRYADFDSLLDYCRRSANPVGTLMLHLYGAADPASLRESDAICSSLQLINFLQDVAVDWNKRRVYLPLEDLHRFGVSEAHIENATVDDAWRALMAFQVERARGMMLSGAPLAFRLPGRIGWELRLIVQGGLRILERIEANDYDVFHRRPQLGPVDWLAMLWKAGRMKIRLSRMAHVG